ncbi:hypothetical protein IWW45_005171, partial [Coemansia sp. RSA 485]
RSDTGMYDYVRRQQELQPGMFLSRTFHWMEQGVRERQPSWTRMYARNVSHDPLALSSSSLFAGPRATPKPASALSSVLQRSAASLSPHRALLTFRRHRQHSDAATRPPSGLSGTFMPRRRGFTAPSGFQPPVFATPVLQQERRPAQPSPGGESGRKPGTEKHKEAFQPISESASVVCPTMQAKADETGTGAVTGAATGVPVYAATGSGASIMTGCSLSARNDQQTEDKASDQSFGDQLSSPSPQLFSSFSPPLSPPPSRTICHRARSFMHRVRSLKPNSGYNIDSRHRQQQQQHERKRRQQDQQNRQQRSGVPLTIASVLCTFDNGTLPRSANNPTMQRHPGPAPRAAANASGGGNANNNSGTGHGASSPELRSPPKDHMSPRCLGGGCFPPGQRRLPRSPLANPLVLDNDSGSDLEKFVKEQPPEPNTASAVATSTAAVFAHADASSSEDEDAVKCQACLQYKGHEWVVGCESGHQLCFGCVQIRVRDLLATRSVSSVRCLVAGCSSSIPSRQLRACLPPQRMRQLSAGSKRADRAVQLVRKSLGLRSPSKHAKHTNVQLPGSANLNDDGFDALYIPEQDTGLTQRIVDESGTVQAVSHSMADLAIADNRSNRSYIERFAASMPVLTDSSGSADASNASTTPPLLSELTHVGHASMDSVVMAATVAADSTVSLSPESVGSRLRRVPKAHENLAFTTNNEHSNGSQTTNNDSPQPTDTPVYTSQGPSETVQHQASALYDYASYELDSYMQTPKQIQAASFVSSSSPISWQQPAAAPGLQYTGARYSSRSSSAFYSSTPPPVPPSLPLQFRASATWITPEQRYSGYTENMLLNATLFETIRRKPSPSNDDDDSEYSIDDLFSSSMQTALQRPPVLQVPVADNKASMLVVDKPSTHNRANDDDYAQGVYIPTWRRSDAPDTTHRQMPLWAGAEYGSQSGVLCEAAELNFDLYETLHKRR